MEKTKPPAYTAFTTPPGLAVYPWLNKPDTEHDAAGIYHVDVSIPFEDAQDLIALLESTRDAFIQTLPVNKQKALTPRPVYQVELTRPEYPKDATKEQKAAIRDAWEGEPTGNILIRTKMKAKITNKDGEIFTQAPTVIHAATGERVNEPVFMGSIVRVKGQIVPYTSAATGVVGITLRLKTVQVIELVSGSGGSSFWTDFPE